MKTILPIIDIENPPSGAIPATVEQLIALGVTPEEIAAGEKRFKSTHSGPWQVTRSISAIVELGDYKSNGVCNPDVTRKAFYPARKCSNPREAGYSMEGTISLAGERRHVFTSSQLFELPDGKLVDVATLHLCNR